jgi:hypothetical protein
MAIVGDHPETGVRFVLERPGSRKTAAGTTAEPESAGPWVYAGDAFTPDTRFSLEVHVSAAGDVRVESGAALPPDIAEKVRLLFRTLYRQAKDTPGGEPPRKVVRWRGEK